ncbi:MAG: OmpH family outer membrane protein [Alistipes sp.]|nr:OmpH family outer membrane protein [Alistipes sp.]
MKKSLFFILAASALMASCAGSASGNADKNVTASDSTEVRTVECVASGDVVYVDLDYIMSSSKLYASEGKALETKMQEFQVRAAEAQDGWAKKEQSLAQEYNKLQNEAMKLQQDYEKGLVTTLKAQERQAELQKKGESIQTRMTALQTTVQTEGQKLQTEEQALAEEQMVLMNRFQSIARKAIEELNADRRYKMIINAVSVVDADPSLNISDLVLKKVDELYEAGALE